MYNNEINNIMKNHSEKDLENFAKTHLNKEKQKELKKILADENRLKQILNSPSAQQLLKKIRGEKNG